MPDCFPELLSETQPHDPYAALRVSDFRFYLFGWMFGVIGQQIQSIAIGWEVYHRTGKAISLGYVGGVQAIPVLLLALPAGQLADSIDRRKVLLVSLLLSIACSLGLATSSFQHGSISLMYLLLFLGSVALTLGRPARQALLPQIVPPRIFSNATTWNSSTFQVASMAGPALGGLIVAFNVPLAYLVDAVCTLICCVFVFTIKLRPCGPHGSPSYPSERPSFASLVTGLRFVWRTKILLAAISLDLFAVLLGGATYLLPIYAQDILKVGPTGFGWLRSAPAIGALVMAMVLAHRPPMQNAGRSLLLAVVGFGVATIVFGLSRSFWLSLCMLFLTGALDNISVVIRHTLVQLLTPDRMRGRVSAVNSVFIGASNELGGLESGLTAAWFGPVPSVVLGGIGAIVVVSSAALIWPALRRFGSLADARPEESSLVES